MKVIVSLLRIKKKEPLNKVSILINFFSRILRIQLPFMRLTLTTCFLRLL